MEPDGSPGTMKEFLFLLPKLYLNIGRWGSLGDVLSDKKKLGFEIGLYDGVNVDRVTDLYKFTLQDTGIFFIFLH